MKLALLLLAALPAYPQLASQGPVGACGSYANCRAVKLFISNITANTTTDFGGYTPAATRAFIVMTVGGYVNVASNCYLQINRSGATVRFTSVFLPSGIFGALNISTPFVVAAGDILQARCDATSSNIWVAGLEYDANATSPRTMYNTVITGPGLDNLIYTIGTGNSASAFRSYPLAGQGICAFVNYDSTQSTTVSLYLVPNAGTFGTGNTTWGGTSSVNTTNNLGARSPVIGSADSIHMSASTNTSQNTNMMAYCTLQENPQ